MGLFGGLAGGILGGLTGATAPKPRIFDYKKAGVKFLTGSADDRIKQFSPIKDLLVSRAMGKGLVSSAAERAKLAAGEIARLKAGTKTIQQGINQRSLSRGHGAGSGMTEAAHLIVTGKPVNP